MGLHIAVVFISIYMRLGGKAKPTWQRYSGGGIKQISFFTRRTYKNYECVYAFTQRVSESITGIHTTYD